MNKLYMIELVRYDSLDRTVLRFYRKGGRIKTHRNPAERNIDRVAKAVMDDEWRVRPFLAGEVGWVAERVR